MASAIAEGRADGAGRGVFAQRSVSPGGLLMSGLPIAAVVLSSHGLARCATCFVHLDKPRTCSRCKVTAYCSETCQRNDWPDHRAECERLARVHPRVFPTTLRLAMRLLQACDRDDKLALAIADHTFARSLVDNGTMEMYGQFAIMIESIMPQRKHFSTASDLVDLLCRIGSNAVYIVDKTLSSVGVGFYGAPISLLNHSCAPNAVVVFRGRRCEVRAAVPIPSGAQVVVGYTDLTHGTPERVSQLWQRYQFICRCPRCLWFTQSFLLQPPPSVASVVCTRPGCEGEAVVVGTASSASCASCGTVIPTAGEVVKATDRAAALLSDKETKLADLQAIMNELDASPLRLSVLAAAIEAANVAKEVNVVKVLGSQLIHEYERRFPWHPLLANELFCQGKLAMQLDHTTRANALTLMRRAFLLLEQLYGSDEPMAREALELIGELEQDVKLEHQMEKPEPARIEPY